MKMVMIAYNIAIDDEIMEVLSRCGVGSYTKWTRVLGKGTSSGPHLGTEVWPGENCVLMSAVSEEKVSQILSCVRNLRQMLGKEGVKAFVLPLEEIT